MMLLELKSQLEVVYLVSTQHRMERLRCMAKPFLHVIDTNSGFPET